METKQEELKEELDSTYNILIDHIGSEYYVKRFKPYIDYNFNLRIEREPLLLDNRNNQFSKGLQRLKYWVHLAYDDPPRLWNGKHDYFEINELTINNDKNNLMYDEKIFVLTALMIIFQVFGDGNHRTAYKFFTDNINRELTTEEIQLLDLIHRNNDYHRLIHQDNPIKNIQRLTNELIDKYRYINRIGGKIRSNNKSKTNKKPKTNNKSKTNKKPKTNNKSKTNKKRKLIKQQKLIKNEN